MNFGVIPLWSKKKIAWIGAAVSTALIAGCGGGGDKAAQNPPSAPVQQEQPKAPEKPPEPVTLKFYTRTVIDDFEKYINQFVKKKFPHVTLEVINNEKGNEIQNLIAAGNIPDIIWEGLTNMGGVLAEYDVPMDLTPLAQKHGFDFNQFDPKMLDSIKSYSQKGEILYLPYNVLVFANHYNKDIFDKFGVPYPKDNMTWEEVAELGKRITRKEGDVLYIGLRNTLNVNRMQTQLSLPYVDASGEKAALTTDGWKRMFETFKMVNDFPGAPQIKSFFDSRNEFLNARTVGMLPDILQLQNSDMVALEKEGLRWDIVTYPVFPDRPGVGVGVFSDGFVLPKGSKNPDLSFQIITYLSTNPEVQLEATKNGRITALKDKSILEHAFENNPAAKGKNLQAAFALQYPAPVKASPYNATGQSIINRKLLDYVNGKSDVNTLLSQGNEEFNQKINELKAR